ncbi:sensor histidine kinase [Bacillus sp. EB600]|uniref:sensor histidine kinase n=1 Tax=Bacillus sp. EB600 TaxID=2806345 RepID=UPI00210E8F4F|nr:HAMP domain-containing sensor histidine kinase [Bacillus sp. EB600]MCQ6282176.1 HAMP domain-containing histidine kinase [Bacillus sp. EB600]
MIKVLILFFLTLISILLVFERYLSKKKLRDYEKRYQVLYKRYEDIESNNQYVEKVNLELMKRIHTEKQKYSQKDHKLIQQSRLAAMGEMIANIGYQWRQPLNNLSLLIQDVSEAQEFDEINDEYITRLTKESMALIKHMSRSINDLRKFYQQNNEKTAFSLPEAIEEALSIFSLNLTNYDIHVHFEYRGQHSVFGYQNEFIQVFLHLLMNARDAFVINNVKNRKICIKIDEDECFYMIEIIDNGGGMDRSLLDKIFHPYFTTKTNGTGLGLFMTKNILESMNGSVKAENTGDGAKFLLFVPKVVATETQETA